MIFLTLCRPVMLYPAPLLARVIQQVSEQIEPVKLCFHEGAGSPDGMSTICDMIAAIEQKQAQVEYEVFTAGEGLLETHMQALSKRNVVVGSLPGTSPCLPERYRQAERVTKHLMRYHIRTYLREMIDSDLTQQGAGRVYRFLMEKGWTHQSYRLGPKRKALDWETYRAFLLELFQLWWQDRMDGIVTYIAEFDALAGLLKGNPSGRRDRNGQWRDQNVIAPDGQVFPYLFDLPQAPLGDLMVDDLTSLERRYQQSVSESEEIPKKCRRCRWVSLCYGDWDGYMGDRAPMCQAYRDLYDLAVPRLLDLLRKIGRSFPQP